MSDFKSKLKEIIFSSFGDSENFYSAKNSPITNIKSTPSFARHKETQDNSNINKWRIDFSIDNFKRSKNTNSVKGYSSIKKLDVFSSDKYQDRFSNLSRFEKSSNKLNLDLSTCFNSMLKIKNLKQSVESKKVKNFMNNLTTEKEVTLKNTKALYQLNDSKGKITKSSAIQKTFDENLNHHNKSRDFSMNSTAIGSVIGDLHNITNSKLIKEIYSYSGNLKGEYESAFNKKYQKPALSLNTPLYQMDNKSFIEFSPINVRKNYMVTGTRPKSISKHSSSGFFNSNKKVNQNFLNSKLFILNKNHLETTFTHKNYNLAKLRKKNLFES